MLQNQLAERVINTRLVVYKQGTKISKTIFGFMGLWGKDVVMVSDKAPI